MNNDQTVTTVPCPIWAEREEVHMGIEEISMAVEILVEQPEETMEEIIIDAVITTIVTI